MTRSRLDDRQILQNSYDEASSALKVTIPAMTTAIELSHTDGDSVLAYAPSSSGQVSSSEIAINTQVVAPLDVSGLQAVQLYGEVTSTATGVAVYKVQISPSASGADWFDLASATITMGTTLGATSISAVYAFSALRLRVVTAASHALTAGTIKISAVVR